jgi:hypothetical protein
MVTITWQDGDQTPDTFTIADDVLASLEKFRLTPHFEVGPDRIHSTVQQMLLTPALELIVKPALRAFPTAALAGLHSQAEEIKKQLSAAHAAAVAQVPAVAPPAS